VHLTQGDQAALAERFDHRGGSGRFGTDHHDRGIALLYIGCDPGRQPPAADREDHQVDVTLGRIEDLLGHGALSGNRLWIVEWVDENPATLAAVFLGGLVRLVVRVAHQPDLDVLATKVLDPLDLLDRRDPGHENRAADSQMGADPGHSLGVVAGAGTHDGSFALLGRKRADLVVGTPDLERANLLQVLALDQDVGAERFGKPFQGLERRVRDDAAQPTFRLVDGTCHLHTCHSAGKEGGTAWPG